MKIRSKLVIYIFAIVSISLLILGSLSYILFFRISTNQLEQETASAMEQVTIFIRDKIEEIDILTEKAQFYSKSSYDLMNDLRKYRDGDFNQEEFYYTQEEIRGIFRTLIYRIDNLKFISLALPSGEIISYSNGQDDFRYGANVLNNEWYRNALSNKGDLSIDVVDTQQDMINSDGEPKVFISRAIYDLYSKKSLGVLSIVCAPEYFSDSAEILPSMITKYSLSNNKNQMIFGEPPNKNDFGVTQTKTIPTNGGEIVYSLLIDHSKYQQLLYKIFLIIISLLILMLGPLIWVILRFSLQFTNPITSLSRLMTNNQKIHGQITNYTKNTLELNTLYLKYNDMLERIENHNLNLLHYQQSLSKSELNVYKNQIDSHFLYNTLESINSIAETEELDDISEMIISLSHMFRYTSNGFDNQATLLEEIMNVEDFICIQQIRFQQKIDFLKVIYDDHLYTKVVPKIILQPLVENAIFHGFNKGRVHGKIRLFVLTNSGTLVIRLLDDGVGIPPDKLSEIRLNLSKSRDLVRTQSNHVGLINIDARLKHTFGDKYGVTVFSNNQNGTLVEIKIPLEGREQ